MSVVSAKILIAAGQPQSGGDEEDEGMSQFWMVSIFVMSLISLIAMVCCVRKIRKYVKQRRME